MVNSRWTVFEIFLMPCMGTTAGAVPLTAYTVSFVRLFSPNSGLPGCHVFHVSASP